MVAFPLQMFDPTLSEATSYGVHTDALRSAPRRLESHVEALQRTPLHFISPWTTRNLAYLTIITCNDILCRIYFRQHSFCTGTLYGNCALHVSAIGRHKQSLLAALLTPLPLHCPVFTVGIFCVVALIYWGVSL